MSRVMPSSSASIIAKSVQRTTLKPLIVALADGRAERLLGNDFRQDDEAVRIIERQPLRIEGGGIGGIDVAAAGIEGLDRLVRLFEGDHLNTRYPVGAEIVRHVLFVVVPVSVQTEAPESSLTLFTPISLRTMKA